MKVQQLIVKNKSDFRNQIAKLMTDKCFLYNRLLPAIKCGVDNFLLKVPIIELKLKDKETFKEISLSREAWPPCLDLIMNELISDELYEKCIEIQELNKNLF